MMRSGFKNNPVVMRDFSSLKALTALNISIMTRVVSHVWYNLSEFWFDHIHNAGGRPI